MVRVSILVNATQHTLKRGTMTKLKRQTPKIDSEFHGSSHITKPGSNIFLDLGFPEKEAAELWEKSKQKIALKEMKASVKKSS